MRIADREEGWGDCFSFCITDLIPMGGNNDGFDVKRFLFFIFIFIFYFFAISTVLGLWQARLRIKVFDNRFTD